MDVPFDSSPFPAVLKAPDASTSRDRELIASSLQRIRQSRAMLKRRVFTPDNLHRPA